jgi:hypothetical protein
MFRCRLSTTKTLSWWLSSVLEVIGMFKKCWRAEPPVFRGIWDPGGAHESPFMKETQ